MKVIIESKSAKRLAAVEHHGDPNELIKSVNKLIEWSNKPSINLKLKENEVFGFTYNDPKQVPKEEFRFDFAMTIPEGLKLQGEIVERRIPEGRYAIAVHKGSRDNIGDTIYALYRDWLPQSNEKLGDLPCVFCYKNFDHNVADTELLTECWLLLK